MTVEQREASKSIIHDIDLLCQHYLTLLYQDTHRKTDSAKDNVCETYGEILYPGIDKLLTLIKPDCHDVFVDYGSGLGKVVLQVYLKSQVKAIYGIECLPDLHQHALNAAQKLKKDLQGYEQKERRLDFILGDFLKIPVNDVTIAFVNSTCFTQSLLNALGKKLDNMPQLHTLLSTRPIGVLKRLRFTKAFRIECSWDSALCYVYKR